MNPHIQIAICDDEASELNYVRTIVESWAQQSGHHINIETFASAEAFLFHYAENKAYDILLLDIEMKEMNGIMLAKQIRATLRRDNDALQIIFVTGYSDYIAEGYEVAALHYLLKPLRKEKLFLVLDKLKKMRMRKKQEEKILFRAEEGPLSLPASKIWYIEAMAHGTELVLEQEKEGHRRILRLEAADSISQFESRLQKDFVRCHRSYLVNLMRIERITKTEILLDTQNSVPLSRRRYAAVNQAFIEYYTKEKT